TTFTVTVSTARNQQSSDNTDGVRNRSQQADIQSIFHASGFHQRRQIKTDAIQAHHAAKINDSHQPHFAAGEDAGDRMRLLGTRFSLDIGFQNSFFIARQPFGACNGVWQIAQAQQAQNQGRNGFQYKQPLPTVPTMYACEKVQNPAREWATNDTRNRNADHEQGVHAATALRREPVSQIQHDAREEDCFSHAQQEANVVEHRRRGHKHGGSGQNGPRNHDTCDPHTRTNTVHDDVAWYFKHEVANEENAGTKAIDSFAELQITQHRQFGKADIDAVQISGDVAKEKERQQTQGYFCVNAILQFLAVAASGCGISCAHVISLSRYGDETAKTAGECIRLFG